MEKSFERNRRRTLRKKCTYHFTKHEFDPSGFPFLNPKPTQTRITVQISNQPCAIQELSPHQTHKTLGCHKAPNGSNRVDLPKTKSDAQGLSLHLSDCSPRESWTHYYTMHLASVTYSLAVASYTESQLEKTQQKAMHHMLPKCGCNRHTRRSLVHGPVKYGGGGFLHSHGEQGWKQIYMFLKYWRCPSQIGSML